MDISLYKETSKDIEIQITDEDSVVDLTGAVLKWSLTDWRGKVLLEKESTNPSHLEITDAAEGLIKIYIHPNDTKNLSPATYLYNLKLTDASNKVYIVLTGNIQVLDVGTLAFVRNQIRNYTGDKEELNLLIQGLESTDEELNTYIQKAVDYFNGYGYQTNYTVYDYPNLGNLIDGTIIQILIGKGILSSRNVLTYNDAGGITVQDTDTYGRYINYFNILISKYIQQVADIKRSINIEGVYTDMSSPMANINTEIDYITYDSK